MSDIKVSICISSIKPTMWQLFEDGWATNKIPYEVIFVGHVKPDFYMPKNMRYIYSPVKPVQCIHIAVLESKGELIQIAADDLELSPEALDRLYDTYTAQNNYKAIVCPRFFDVPPYMGGVDVSETMARLVDSDINSPYIGIAGLISRKYYNELGGLDRRFIFSFSDVDMYVNAQINGGKLIWNYNTGVAERKDLVPNIEEDRSKNYSTYDHFLLQSLWFNANNFTGKRFSPVESFEENNIKIKTQGTNTGDWV